MSALVRWRQRGARAKAAVRRGAVHLRRLGRRVTGRPRVPDPPPGTLVADPEAHLFCGYYDVPPLSRDGRLLVMRAAVPNEPLVDPVPAQVGLIRIDGGDRREFLPLGSTDSWCWQQGCRLQWLDPDGGDSVIYNRRVNGAFGSFIVDAGAATTMTRLPFPVYSVSPDGRSALTLNFSRLHRLRPGYGYPGIPDPWADDPAPTGDGIWIADLPSGKMDLLFSTREIAELEPDQSMDGAVHYVNHLKHSPGGGRFLFLHLWVTGHRRFSRLLVARHDGSDLLVLNPRGASHYAWRNEDEILHFVAADPGDHGYVLYDLSAGTSARVARGGLHKDGHPTFLAEASRFVTDTYPDRYGDQGLFLCDLSSDRVQEIGRYSTPPSWNGEVRCDLHPRVSTRTFRVVIDVVHQQRRAIRIIPLPHGRSA